MRRAVKSLQGILCCIMLLVAAVLLVPLCVHAYAETEDDDSSNVIVSGDAINEGYTYYLEWSEISFEYNGQNQIPTATLKCRGDDTFKIVATITVYNGADVIETACDAGEYTAVASCEGVTFASGNSKVYTISTLSRQVQWTSATSYTYNGGEQGPTAKYVDVGGNEVELAAISGLGTDAGTHTASVSENAAGKNYTLTGLTYEYVLSPLSREVQWTSASSYTFNGNPQGPTAKYVDVDGNEVELTVSGIGTDATTHTASVSADAAGENYTLTKLRYEYVISPLNREVQWTSASSYTYNGNPQGPIAKYVDVGRNEVELTVSGIGTDATTHTASVSENAAGGNYTLTGVKYEYVISPLSREVKWTSATSYTYNGNPQGPTAKYVDVDGNEVELTAISGLGTDAGTHTASVAENAAGKNYALTGVTCGYTIEKFAGKVLWIVADYYVANGKPQGPRAFIVGLTGDIMELPVKASGVQAGDYTAEIDMSTVNANFSLSGNLSATYSILPEHTEQAEQPEKQGGAWVALAVTFIVLFLAALGGIAYLLFLRKKDSKIEKVPSDNSVSAFDVHQMQQKNDDEANRLRARNRTLMKQADELRQNLEECEAANSVLRERLSEAEKRQTVEVDDRGRLAELQNRINALSEENKKLKKAIPQDHGFYKRPIEDYFPEIDAAFEEAERCEYDENHPGESFITQRQQLNVIKKWITAYRSQRR